MQGPKCSFLEKLPLEIRYQIYELVFGDNIIIFTFAKRSGVQQCFCRARGEKFHWISLGWLDDTRGYCYTHEDHTPDNHYRREEEVQENRLALLLTCRQIYSEAVKVLWAARPIHMQILGGPLFFRVFPNMKAALAPCHFHAIRSLEISFGHPKVSRWNQVLDERWFAGWNGVWDIIKAMKGLVRIQAWLKMEQAGDPGGNFMTADQEKRLFAPLMGVYHLRDFNVEVTWPENEASEELLRNAPFQLTRNDEPTPNQPEECEAVRIYEHPSWTRT